MTNKKSIWAFVLAVCLIVPAMFMMSACGKDKGGSGETAHTHTYSSTWEHDETHHWHEATCEHATEQGDKAVHTFGNWTVVTPAGLHTAGTEKRECTVCSYYEEREISEIHEYSTSWSKDATNHWHECSCGAKKDEVAHTFDGWTVKTPEDYGKNRVEKRTCSVCGFDEEKEIENSAKQSQTNNITVDTINFTYSGQPKSILGLIEAGNTAGMTIKYEKKDKDSDTYTELTEAPKNAGSYRYTITIPATKEWAKGEKTGTFEIKKYQVTCPDEFVSSLSEGKTATTKLCDVILPENADINLEDVELVYSNPDKPEGYGAGRTNIGRDRIKVTPALADNIEVVGLPGNNKLIQWIVLDENDEFSFKYSEMVDANSCYIGTIDHGYAKVGDKLTILDYNDTKNIFTKVNVTVTAIEYLTNPYDKDKVYKTTSHATKGDKIKITFTKDNASDNIASVRNIVSARNTYEVSDLNGYKSKTVDLSFDSNEFRMLKFKIGTSTKCELTISDAENNKLLKVFNATTGAEITLTEGTFKVAEGTEIYIVIQQGVTKGNQQVTVKLFEYTIG